MDFPLIEALENWIPIFDITLKRMLSKSLNLDVLFMKPKESRYVPGRKQETFQG
jgi:hypothetical protein